MAASKFTSTEIKVLFRMLILLTSSLKFVAQQLQELANHKALTPDYIQKLTVTVQEVEEYLNKNNPL